MVVLCDVRSPASCQHVHVADDVPRCSAGKPRDDSRGTRDAAQIAVDYRIAEAPQNALR